MNFLKAVFTNALVLATLVTSLAGTILVAYAVDKPLPATQAHALIPGAGGGAALSQVVPTAPGERAPFTRENGERTPPIIFWGVAIPGGSYIDAML